VPVVGVRVVAVGVRVVAVGVRVVAVGVRAPGVPFGAPYATAVSAVAVCVWRRSAVPCGYSGFSSCADPRCGAAKAMSAIRIIPEIITLNGVQIDVRRISQCLVVVGSCVLLMPLWLHRLYHEFFCRNESRHVKKERVLFRGCAPNPAVR